MKICQQRVPQSRHQDRHAEASPRDAMVKPSNLQNTKEQEEREQPGEIRLLDTDSHTKKQNKCTLEQKGPKGKPHRYHSHCERKDVSFYVFCLFVKSI